MFWILPIALITLFLLWILLGPVNVFVNTDNHCYYLALPGVFKAALVPSDGLFHIRGWILFIPFRFDPFRRRKKKSKEVKKVRKKKRSKRRSGGIMWIRGVIRAIRIRDLQLDMDSDDFTLNAWLIPAFSMINNERIRMRVNFEGRSSLLLDLRTRIGVILWTFIRHTYTSFYSSYKS